MARRVGHEQAEPISGGLHQPSAERVDPSQRPVDRFLCGTQTAKVGTLIPYELYMAVAEILAFVLRTRGTRGSWEGSALA